MRARESLPWIIRCSMRLYRWLLCLGSDGYRRKYGDLTLQLFQECCEDAYRQRGTWGVLRLWPPLFSDVVAQMLAERSSSRERAAELHISVKTVSSSLPERRSSMNRWERLNRTVIIPMFSSLTLLRRKLTRLLTFKIEPRRIEAENIELPLGSFDESQLLSSMVSSGEMLDQRLLRNLLELALGEARRMHKDYLGTPHLFIALTRLEGGCTQNALRSLGRSPEQVGGAIRRALGSGKATSDTQIHPTRRCKKILQSAERNAINAHSTSVDERAIAQAVLSEEDGALRELLTKHGINPSRLTEVILASM
jgi:Clp amino terminal domain, pathogenicity island component